MWTAKVGAIAYALWSVLHIVLGITRLSDRAADGTLSEAAGRLAQGHWTLLYLGILGLILHALIGKMTRPPIGCLLLLFHSKILAFSSFLSGTADLNHQLQL